ncbi:hypothetical protein [Gloeomargarita lithophora]|uniref:hypothetical protein n=1 Tax=Gloeomargarita lithophora TaxID=1188228 RepID=UPI0008F86E05|nr:hypothetical protein [Gloeomargarita lithophora]
MRVTDTIDTAIRALPEQSAWLRRVITQAAKVELLGDCPAVTPQPGGSQEPSVAASVVEVGEPSSGQIDRAELLQALDEIFKIPRLPKKALIQLQELRERLIQEV